MPTENRSSNTELSKIVTEALVGMVSGVTGMKPPADEPLPGFIQAPIDRAVTRISGLLAQPAPQPHPEPIAWMVGTAFWWTKEEAERDAAATGLPMIPVGTMVDASEVERLREENRVLQKQLGERWADIDALNKSNEEYSAAAVDSGMQSDTLRAQLAELEALHGGELGLPKEGWPEYHKREMESLRDLTVGRYERKLAERDALLRELADAPPAAMEFRLQQKVKAALSASAEPSALGILSRAHDVNMFQRAAEPGAKS
ncbi:hypothetical protein H4C81_22435 [Pseudomonas monteilii]|uniref:hypothetical protein n=1 Tax=Pseudomonas monteilii TaxID=76759 RepID=UPI0015F90C31|nr:hypothetical protein [Pseudomonas monteilii]MBA6091606.1 hypothetical protein [Pseudomonas monteilii]